MKTVEESNRDFAAALDTRLRQEYLRGKADGLRVAKTIRDWLTRQPDRQWQKQVREWAEKAIADADMRNGRNEMSATANQKPKSEAKRKVERFFCPTCRQNLAEEPRAGMAGKDCPQCGQGFSWRKAARLKAGRVG